MRRLFPSHLPSSMCRLPYLRDEHFPFLFHVCVNPLLVGRDRSFPGPLTLSLLASIRNYTPSLANVFLYYFFFFFVYKHGLALMASISTSSTCLLPKNRTKPSPIYGLATGNYRLSFLICHGVGSPNLFPRTFAPVPLPLSFFQSFSSVNLFVILSLNSTPFPSSLSLFSQFFRRPASGWLVVLLPVSPFIRVFFSGGRELSYYFPPFLLLLS